MSEFVYYYHLKNNLYNALSNYAASHVKWVQKFNQIVKDEYRWTNNNNNNQTISMAP